MYTIAIDMDSVTVDFFTSSVTKAKLLYGVNITKEEVDKPSISEIIWKKLSDKQKLYLGNHRNIYQELCGPGFFLNLKPLPGAIQAVNDISQIDNVHIIFLTKPLNWSISSNEKDQWLKEHFPDINYSLMMVDSPATKGFCMADIMVDDDTRALKVSFGQAVCITEPWNKDYNCRFRADSLKNAVRIVRGIINNYERYENLSELDWDELEWEAGIDEEKT